MRDYQADKEKYYWTTAVIFIGSDLNKTLIRYLENRLVEIARESKRYHLLTKNTYKNTVIKETQIAVMEEFINNVKILLNTLGYKVLEPLSRLVPEKNHEKLVEIDEINLRLERTIKNLGKRIQADGVRTSEGFVVLKGSHIAEVDDETIPVVLKEQRKTADIVDGILQEDMLFSSPSYAAMLVIGKGANGLTSWKDSAGKTLKEIENNEIK